MSDESRERPAGDDAPASEAAAAPHVGIAHDDDDGATRTEVEPPPDDDGATAHDGAAAAAPARDGAAPPSLDEALARLARLARALANDPDGPHGGFWPDAAKLDDDRPWVDSERLLAPRLRWAARLAVPEHLGDAAYLPPELAESDGRPTAAADVYSLAALVHRAAVGRAPSARLDVGALQRALGPRRFERVLDGLATDPTKRPTLLGLAIALDQKGPSSVDATDTGARARDAVPPARARDAAPPSRAMGTRARDERSHVPEEAPEPRSFVRPILVVGAVSVFVGALWFIWLSWGRLSDVARLGMVGVFTAGTGAAAEALLRAKFDDAAGALRVLFTQLFWAVGGLVLAVMGALESELGWATVGGAVAVITVATALKRGPQVLLLALAGFALLIAGTLVFAELSTWGRVVFLLGVSFALRGLVYVGDELETKIGGLLGVIHTITLFAAVGLAIDEIVDDRYVRASERTADVLQVMLWEQLTATLLLVGAWVVSRHFGRAHDSPVTTILAHAFTAMGTLYLLTTGEDAYAAIPAAVPTLLALVEAWLARRDAREVAQEFAWLTAATTLWIFAGALLHDLDVDEVSLGVAIVGALVWAAHVAIALVRGRGPVAYTSALHLAVAAVALGDHLSSGTYAGPALYFTLVAFAFLVLAVVAFRRQDALASSHGALAAVFVVVASGAALVLIDGGSRWDERELFGAAFAYAPPALLALLLVVERRPYLRVLGGLAVVALAALPTLELAIRPWSVPLGALAAVVGLVGTGIALFFGDDERATELWGPSGPTVASAALVVSAASAVIPSVVASAYVITKPILERFEYVVLVVLPLAALFGLGLAGANLVERVRAGRLLQLVSSVVYLGAFFLFSIARVKDYSYPALLFVGGAILLAFGVKTRHPQVVLATVVTLVIGFWTQFFLKLHTHAPTSVLLIVFGIAVLIGAVLYERHVKGLVLEVRSWPGI